MSAESRFQDFIKDIPSYHNLTGLEQAAVKSFFTGGYLSGIQDATRSTMNILKENTSERSEPGTTAL